MAQAAKPEPERGTWMDTLARVSERIVPDALTTAIILMVILAVAALMLGDTIGQTIDAYYRGLWMLTAFTMQMTLMLTLSLVLAETPLFRKGVIYLSKIPRTVPGVVTGAALSCAVIAYLNWGLSIALGPLIAVHFAKQAERKGLRVDFNWLMAVLAGAGSVWQFGLSASAPLQMTAQDNFLKDVTQPMPLVTTIWSPASITMVLAFLAVTIILGIFLMPKKVKPISAFPESDKMAEAAITAEMAPHIERKEEITVAKWMEQTRWTILPLCAGLGAWLYWHFAEKDPSQELGPKNGSLDIPSMITILLLVCLLLHGSVARFTGALQKVIVSVWPVVVMYHLYAGVAGLIQYTSVGPELAEAIAPISTKYTLPFLTAAISTIVAIFIPTSGGQWAIQGHVTVTTAAAAGISPQRNLLALSVGDHMGNLIAPFWAVVGAGIARVDFRQIFGYRLIFAAVWFILGVLCFTFLPC